MTIDEAHRALDAWFHENQVGNLIFTRGPGHGHVLAAKQRTIKTREMPDDVRAMVELAFERLECDKAEMFSDRDGGLDRVKVMRSIL